MTIPEGSFREFVANNADTRRGFKFCASGIVAEAIHLVVADQYLGVGGLALSAVGLGLTIKGAHNQNKQ